MKNYTITVNGIAYEVSVQEGRHVPEGSGAPVAPVVAQAAPAPVATPAPVAQEPKAAATGSAGSIEVESPMPGKILKINAQVGQAISKGDVIVILEAMKMENEIVAAEDGTVASVNVTANQMVEAGDIVATLN